MAAALDGLTDSDHWLTAALLHGRATLDDITRRDPGGVDAEAHVRAGFESLHMALDLAELGEPVSAAWLHEAHATLTRSDGPVGPEREHLTQVASRLRSHEFAALDPMVQAAVVHEVLGAPAPPATAERRLAGVVASVYTLRHRKLPSFVPLDRGDEYREALGEAHAGDSSKLVAVVAAGVDRLATLIAEEPPATVVPPPEPVTEPESKPDPEPTGEEPEADDEGDALPADLDISAYVGQYNFPDIHRRRIPGYIYLGVATACFALWVSRRGHDPVLVNNGLVVAAFGFLLVGWYHLATAWPLEVKDTDALIAASREVGFPVGHASAQLGWRGLRSRPTWRILVYSSEDPPAQRGLVLVDGTDGTVLSHFTETNPEDWSAYSPPAG